MATKAETKTKEKKTSSLTGKYFYGVGRRKSATAQVRLYALGKDSVHTINHKPFTTYLPESHRAVISTPLVTTGLEGEFVISATVRGGGVNAQSEAVRLGVARALLAKDETLRTVLRAQGFLTRDARAVERKKPGLKKARRSPQWSKR